jgi:hypothetical protein
MKPSSGGHVVPEVTWRCLPCGATNPITSPFCDNCGSPKPGQTRWPTPEDELWPEDFDTPLVPPETRPPPVEPDPDPPPRSRRAERVAGLIVALVLIATGVLAIMTATGKSHKTTTGRPPATAPGVSSSSQQGPALAPTPGVSGSASPGSSSAPASSAPSGGTPFPSRSGATPTGLTTAPPQTQPPTTPAVPIPILFIGMIDVSAVNTSPHVQAVGGLFDSYFSGINNKDYPQVLALYDPSGGLNTNDPVRVATFTNGISTTTDSRAVLWSIDDNPSHAGNLNVRTTFMSTQSQGFGPAGAPDETCTWWDNTYELSPNGSAYRILNLLRFAHQAC